MSKLIKAEFIKNYSIKKIIVSLLILFVGSLLLILFEKTFGNRVTYDNSFSYHESEYNSIINKYKTDNEKNPSDFNEDLVSVMEEAHENFKLTNNVIKGHNETMWQKFFIRVYMQEVAHKYALNRLDDCDKDEISNYILRYENTGSLDTYHIIKEAYIDYLDSYKNADYQNKKKEVEAKIIRYDKIIKDNKFYGALTLRDLLITKKDEDLDEKIILSYPFVYDREEITDAAIDALADYSEDSIPVLNKDTNQIVGVITSADIVELINEEEEEEKKEVEKAETKKVNYYQIIAFVLLLLVALNSIFGLVPSVTYVEIALVIIAIFLQVYGHSSLSKQ